MLPCVWSLENDGSGSGLKDPSEVVFVVLTDGALDKTLEWRSKE